LIADDHPLFRDGVSALLAARGYDVVGEACDGLEALDKAREFNPDLVLMDINMPRLDGLAATRILTTEQPTTHVVMLTVSDGEENLFEAIKSGAIGYLLKNTETDTFFAMIDGATKDEAPISRQLAGTILREFASKMTAIRRGRA
jgi:DNA-binding NarL/FixJ family response regulator